MQVKDLKSDRRNYRKHNQKNLSLIKKSISEVGLGRSIVIDNENEIICGNGLVSQLDNNTPVKIIETDGSELVVVKRTDLQTDDDKRKRLAVLDNSTSDSSEFDVDLLQEDFDIPELEEMGIEIDNVEDTKIDEPTDEKIEEAEKLINEAVREACNEIVLQYDVLDGFSFITKHTAKINFIKFVYYKKEYARFNSLAFHPLQFKTSGDRDSAYDGLLKIVDGEINPERLRYVTGDNLSSMCNGTLAFRGCKMPLDFPSDLARDLMNEFASGGKVLDPCSGWGGRLVGFLASKAIEYNGVDASPNQVAGDLDIYETFRDVVSEDKVVDIQVSPFEKYSNKHNYYDLVLTSPPYFDREKYIGGEQSHNYSNYEVWKESFYAVLINKAYQSLKAGGVMCLQVGSQFYPLLEDGKKIAQEAGFEFVEVRTTQMTNSYNKTAELDGEVVLVCRKPE